MNYAKEIQSIARRHSSASYEVGDHRLFGFSVDSEFLSNPKYDLETIVQIDLMEEDENNISIYLLPYFWLDEEQSYVDHDDICFFELTEEEKKNLYEEFKKTYEPTTI